MQTSSNTCTADCRGQCLHGIELIPEKDPSAAAFCDSVWQFMSKDAGPKVTYTKQRGEQVEQPCANFVLCGKLEPQWVLDLNSGICHHPCSMMYGRAFAFSNFAADEACPLCLETGLSSVVFQCKHMVCAGCYGRAAFSEAAAETLKRCPMCRVASKPRMRDMVLKSFFH